MSVLVELCQGTACFVMGSEELYDIKAFMPEAWQEHVDVTSCVCIGRCKKNRFNRAPFARVNGEIVESVTPASLLRLIAEIMGDEDYMVPEELS